MTTLTTAQHDRYVDFCVKHDLDFMLPYDEQLSDAEALEQRKVVSGLRIVLQCPIERAEKLAAQKEALRLAALQAEDNEDNLVDMMMSVLTSDDNNTNDAPASTPVRAVAKYAQDAVKQAVNTTIDIVVDMTPKQVVNSFLTCAHQTKEGLRSMKITKGGSIQMGLGF